MVSRMCSKALVPRCEVALVGGDPIVAGIARRVGKDPGKHLSSFQSCLGMCCDPGGAAQPRSVQSRLCSRRWSALLGWVGWGAWCIRCGGSSYLTITVFESLEHNNFHQTRSAVFGDTQHQSY